ncbi:membrane protein DedA with SNARE-associated domain [Motilibacter peucedani]|uniref:Membrane protein DedA with SNARE-associated domain n=1 Tax=Motilibacter peucedani TaxID=598650 RepID=A0A420XMG2_9ACTN|nr:DedA family protein [Motilibacter peucedani]RKS72425.1 membrane protein DedA with SNARE-associated domain [Motilibacter peucedani]
MGGVKDLADRLLNVAPGWVYLIVTLVVFAEDAFFLGFVLPGETVAVLGGVAASQGHVSFPVMLVLVVLAAIVGDSVGYELGRILGPRMLRNRLLAGRREQLEAAQRFLARRGGMAVLLGRWVAFFRAVMPALAGCAEMHYRKFLVYNALGGVIWGSIVVTVGYVAGDSYKRVEAQLGRGVAAAAAVVVVGLLLAWHVHRRRAEKS